MSLIYSCIPSVQRFPEVKSKSFPSLVSLHGETEAPGEKHNTNAEAFSRHAGYRQSGHMNFLPSTIFTFLSQPGQEGVYIKPKPQRVPLGAHTSRMKMAQQGQAWSFQVFSKKAE